MKNYIPKIVIIEINSDISPGILKRHNGKDIGGNSFSLTLEVALKKGYILTCHTGNLTFVKKELLNLVKIKEKYIKNLELLFDGRYIFNNFFIRLFYKFIYFLSKRLV